jgi:hypothetical protein
VYPTHHDGVATIVGNAKFAAIMCALQITQEIQHGLAPFR